MPNLVQTYILPDFSDPTLKRGAIRIHVREAKAWNEKGYGVFHTVQEFYLNRKIENLRHINAWAIDMDEGEKPQMLERIKLGLIPTMIIETKRGYHVYWAAKDASTQNYKNIVGNRLVPFYKADKRAKDLARLLRTPGFYHMKDPTDPYLIKKVHSIDVQYSEKEMFAFYKDLLSSSKQKRIHAKARSQNPEYGDFWDAVWNLNCEDALTKLSGSPHVGGETYSFTENASGTKNIWVNGKGTSCWIDEAGRIGSADSGGPTIYQWLNWFHKNPTHTIEIIKQEFPECLPPTPQMTLI